MPCCRTVPSIFLAAPDESSAFIVLPGQKWLLQRRGYEAAVLTGIGALCGLGVLVIASPIAGEASRVLSDHRVAAPGLDIWPPSSPSC